MANMRYGAYAQIYFGTAKDTNNKTLTNPYTDKGVFVYNENTNTVVTEDGYLPTYISMVNSRTPAPMFIDGWKYSDDQGTFLNDNDVSTSAPTIDVSAIKMNTAGNYTAYANIKDGSGNVVASAKRHVAVLSNSGFALNLSIEGVSYDTVESANFVIDYEGNSSLPNPLLIAVFTGNQKQSAMNIAPSDYGVAIILDKYGDIARVYNGADAKYYDSANMSGVTTVPGTSTTISYTNYDDLAFNSLKTGEYMILGNYDATYIQVREILREARRHIGKKFDIWNSVTSGSAVPFEVLFASKN